MRQENLLLIIYEIKVSARTKLIKLFGKNVINQRKIFARGSYSLL
jgi:hypothetical protein